MTVKGWIIMNKDVAQISLKKITAFICAAAVFAGVVLAGAAAIKSPTDFANVLGMQARVRCDIPDEDVPL